MFAGLWHSCGKKTKRPAPLAAHKFISPQRASTAGTRLVCDAPKGVLPGVSGGAMHMLAELLAGIARARDFIYVEHQYLTSRPIAAALAAALAVNAKLQIIIVLNQNPDLTAYRAWQNAQLTQRALLGHLRVGVFSLWSTEAHTFRDRFRRISPLFIHSKVMIVDDQWAAVGTSNLDGVSMGDYGDDFAGALGRRVFRGVRNVEVNVIIDAQDAHSITHGKNTPLVHESEARTILALRERLWREHLGASPRKRPESGWLAVWRAVAAKNLRALGTEPAVADSRGMIGRVLPYSTRAFPSEQLAELGIDLPTASLELCYNPTWLSVHASLQWIRNIF